MDVLKKATIVNGKFEKVPDLTSKCSHLGLYFSAHWCPPCRAFTPKLVEWYKECRKVKGDTLEIVFVSSDRNEEQFKEYFAGMPWLAVDFSAKEIRAALADSLDLTGIPTLVFFETSGNGKVVVRDGRSKVLKESKDFEFN